MLNYRVNVADPQGHYFDVELTFDLHGDRAAGDGHQHWIDLTLPVWIPGSYMIREFSRHVIQTSASSGRKLLVCEKVTKNCWRVYVPQGYWSKSKAKPLPMKFKSRIYAWDLSVRAAHLDESHGFFNGTSLFLCPKGYDAEPIQLTVERPDEDGLDWLVATGLKPAATLGGSAKGCQVLKPGKSLSYKALDYDDLIDHPVEMGELLEASFTACGVRHIVAIYGADTDVDMKRLCEDLKPVCEAQIRLFEPESGKAPFQTYWFLVHATDSGYGGLEHRNSTSLLCAREDLPQVGVKQAPKGYETFLGLCSHEYFHSWNVKRMKPAAFVPYRLDEENYTRLLWVFEGFTSYYDDLILARTGLMNEAAYLKALAKTYAQVHKSPGHLMQSVSESSFEAWTKYYRQDENSPNSIVSYYTKGALVAFCLDATIRKRTQGKQTLDDVMRGMWQEKGLTGVGLDEEELPRLVERVTGLNLDHELHDWTRTTSHLPIEECLSWFGYRLEVAPAELPTTTGLTGQYRQDGLLVKQVVNSSPAHEAGVASGDVIVAINAMKMTEKNHKRLQLAGKPKTKVECVGFRAERLYRCTLTLAATPTSEWSIKPASDGKSDSGATPKNGHALPAPWLQKNSDFKAKPGSSARIKASPTKKA